LTEGINVANNSKPKFAYDNRLMDLGVLFHPSSEAVGFYVENLTDWRPQYSWKTDGSSAQSLVLDLGANGEASCLAIANHNYFTKNLVNLKLEYSDTGISGPWEEVIAAFTPASNGVVWKTFDELNKQYWKLSWTASDGDVETGVLFLGTSFACPSYPQDGFNPLQHTINMVQAQSEDGWPLGSIETHRPIRLTLELEHVSEAWRDAYWNPFYTHLPLPYFFAWDETNHEDEALFLWPPENIEFNCAYSPMFFKLSFEMLGRKL
jgi:hypothetical protein